MVLYIALALADHSLILRTPSLVDVDSLAVIVALLTVSRGIELSGAFSRIAPRILKVAGGSPARLVALVALATALSSAVIMNDTAMFIFIPLVVMISRLTGMDRAKAVAVTAIAANVGSSLTPIGNPQNIIVWRRYGLTPHEFVAGIAPYVLTWLALLMVLVLAVYREAGKVTVPPMPRVKVKRALLATSTALLVLDVVLAQAGQPLIGLAVTLTVLTLIGREAVLSLDVPLILIFTLIFIDFREVSALIAKAGVLNAACFNSVITVLVAALLSQAVSNVPATVMLASANPSPPWLPLAVGVNVGGTGIVIGSLANLIAVRIAGIRLRDFHKYSIPFFLTSLITSALMTYVLL